MNRRQLLRTAPLAALAAQSEAQESKPFAGEKSKLKITGVRLVQMRPRKRGHSSTTTLRSLYYPFKMTLSVFVVMMREPPPRLSGNARPTGAAVVAATASLTDGAAPLASPADSKGGSR